MYLAGVLRRRSITQFDQTETRILSVNHIGYRLNGSLMGQVMVCTCSDVTSYDMENREATGRHYSAPRTEH